MLIDFLEEFWKKKMNAQFSWASKTKISVKNNHKKTKLHKYISDTPYVLHSRKANEL